MQRNLGAQKLQKHHITYCALCEHVVQNPIGHKLVLVLTANVAVQHFQLRLALVELFVVPFLQGNPSMRLVHLHCKLTTYTLNLKQDLKLKTVAQWVSKVLWLFYIAKKSNKGFKNKRVVHISQFPLSLTVKSCLMDFSWSQA